uniref:Uncharacterized protein n=1 Tax=Bursaphelenchus xylophilus TaxID=6326 RepID=A0A1I7RW37_BURXY
MNEEEVVGRGLEVENLSVLTLGAGEELWTLRLLLVGFVQPLLETRDEWRGGMDEFSTRLEVFHGAPVLVSRAHELTKDGESWAHELAKVCGLAKDGESRAHVWAEVCELAMGGESKAHVWAKVCG